MGQGGLMKKLMVISILVIALSAVAGYFRMGIGMMDSQKGEAGDMVMQHGEMGQGNMMMHGEKMMGGMMKDMNRMTGMMQGMSDMMEKGMSAADMAGMSEIMKEMCGHMMNMSRMMKDGNVSQDEMQKLHQQMLQTQKKFDMMQMR